MRTPSETNPWGLQILGDKNAGKKSEKRLWETSLSSGVNADDKVSATWAETSQAEGWQATIIGGERAPEAALEAKAK